MTLKDIATVISANSTDRTGKRIPTARCAYMIFYSKELLSPPHHASAILYPAYGSIRIPNISPINQASRLIIPRSGMQR